MAIPIRITVRKLFPMRSAIEAGRTMMVDTKRAPAAGIIKAMATPVTILKAMDMARTGRPSTKAVSSSKVRMYMGLRNKTVKIRITAAITAGIAYVPFVVFFFKQKAAYDITR